MVSSRGYSYGGSCPDSRKALTASTYAQTLPTRRYEGRRAFRMVAQILLDGFVA